MAQRPRAVTDERERAAYERDYSAEAREVVPQQGRPTFIEVQRHLNQSGAEVANEGEMQTLRVRMFEVEPAEVSLELGVVVKTGDYQTARVTVGVRMPCYVEEVEDAYVEAENFVKERLGRERDEIVSWAQGKGIKNLF